MAQSLLRAGNITMFLCGKAQQNRIWSWGGVMKPEGLTWLIPAREMLQQARLHIYLSAIFQPIFGYCWRAAGNTCAPAHTQYTSGDKADILLNRAATYLLVYFSSSWFCLHLRQMSNSWPWLARRCEVTLLLLSYFFVWYFLIIIAAQFSIHN